MTPLTVGGPFLLRVGFSDWPGVVLMTETMDAADTGAAASLALASAVLLVAAAG